MTYYTQRPTGPVKLSPAEFRRTAFKLAGILVLVGVLLFAFLTPGMRERKLTRETTRAWRDLQFVRAALEAYAERTGAAYPVSAEATLPEDFATEFAEQRGGQPFYQEQGRVARLDLFSPERPYTAPLRYVTDGAAWVVASRGPSREFAIGPDLLEDGAEELAERLRGLSYDPTNGLYSSGDMWVSNRARMGQ
jgi:hypothetical protein